MGSSIHTDESATSRAMDHACLGALPGVVCGSRPPRELGELAHSLEGRFLHYFLKRGSFVERGLI